MHQSTETGPKPGFAEQIEKGKKPFKKSELLKLVKKLYDHLGQPDGQFSWALNRSLEQGSLELAKKAVITRLEQASQAQNIKAAEILKEIYNFLEAVDQSTLVALSKEEEQKIKAILANLDSEKNRIIAYTEAAALGGRPASGSQFFKITELKQAIDSGRLKQVRKILALVNRESTPKNILKEIDELVSLLPAEEFSVDPGTTSTAGESNLYNDSSIQTARDAKKTNYPGMDLPFTPEKNIQEGLKPFNPSIEDKTE